MKDGNIRTRKGRTGRIEVDTVDLSSENCWDLEQITDMSRMKQISNNLTKQLKEQ